MDPSRNGRRPDQILLDVARHATDAAHGFLDDNAFQRKAALRGFRGALEEFFEDAPSKGAETPDAPPGRSAAAILADPATSAPPEPTYPPYGRRGKVTLAHGREKEAGKTTWLAFGAACITGGRQHLGHETTRAPVVWWPGVTESSPAEVAELVGRFGGDLEQLYIVEETGNPFELLHRACSAWRPSAVIADSLSSLLGAQGIDLKPGDALGYQAQIARLKADVAVRHDCAVILIHHDAKAGGYRDSTGIGGAADLLVSIQPTKVEGERELTALGRWRVPTQTVRLVEGDVWRYELVSGSGLSVDALIVLHVQAHPGCSLREVREAVGGNNLAVSRAVDRLIGRGAIKNLGAGDRFALYPGAAE